MVVVFVLRGKMMFTDKERLNIVEGITTLKLKFSTRIVLVKLINLASDKGSIIVERNELAVRCNVSPESIGRAVKQLAQLEYIQVDMRRVTSESGIQVRSANSHTINLHRITHAIRERAGEIENELQAMAA